MSKEEQAKEEFQREQEELNRVRSAGHLKGVTWLRNEHINHW